MTYENYIRGNGRDRSTDQIQSDLGNIRNEISHTVDDLVQRLQPGELLQQALQSFRKGGGGRFMSNLSQTVQDNPVPIAMIAGGLAYLMYSDSRQRSGGGYRIDTNKTDPDADWESGSEGEGRGERFREGIKSKAEGIKSATHAARDRAGQAAANVRERLSDVRDRAGARARQARDVGHDVFERQPLVLTGLGLALGAALAGLAPMSDRERRVMGEAGRRTRDEAKRLTSAAVEKGQEAVHAEGGVVAELKDDVKQSVEKIKDGAKDLKESAKDKGTQMLGASSGTSSTPDRGPGQPGAITTKPSDRLREPAPAIPPPPPGSINPRR